MEVIPIEKYKDFEEKIVNLQVDFICKLSIPK